MLWYLVLRGGFQHETGWWAMQGLNLRLPPCEGVEAEPSKTADFTEESPQFQPAPGANGEHPEGRGLAGAARAAAEGPPGRSGFVYFIQASNGGPVKIGFSRNPRVRIGDLQVGSPANLRIIARFPGSIADERALHVRLSGTRSHGEWYWRTPELEAVLVEKIGRIPARLRHGKRPEFGRFASHFASSRCSFCGRPADEVGGVVRGAQADICLECAELAVRCHARYELEPPQFSMPYWIERDERSRMDAAEPPRPATRVPLDSPAPGLLPLHEARKRIRERAHARARARRQATSTAEGT